MEQSNIFDQAEEQIDLLGNQEMQLVNQLKNTVQLKQQLMQDLAKKSPQLIKSIEPRKAYILKPIQHPPQKLDQPPPQD